MPTRDLSAWRVVAFVGVVVGSLLAVAPWGFDEFGPLRWLLVSVFGFTAVAIAGALPIRIDRLTTIWFGLVAWLGLASALAIDRLHAWVGTPDRHFGFLTWMLCGGLFVVAWSLGQRDRRIVLRSVVVTSILVGAYALFEQLGVAGFASGFAGDRLGGPFGQPAFLGASMALVAPICVGMAVDRDVERMWRVSAWLGTAAALFAVLGSQARAAWIGLVVAAGLVVWHNHRRIGLKLVAIGAGGAVIAGTCLALLTPVGSRARSLFDGGGVTAGRVDEWQVGLRALSGRPITGYGPEGYRTVFGRHVDIDYVIEHGRSVITDRAHAGLLDVALAGGVPAAVLYTALVILLFRALWPQLGAAPSDAGVGAGVIAYLVQQQFLFPIAEIDPLVWMIAGLALAAPSVAAATAQDAAPIRSIEVSPMLRGLLFGVAVLAGMAGIADVVADRRTAVAVAESDPQIATSQIDAARRRAVSIRYDFIASRLWGPSSLEESAQRIEDGLRLSSEDPALLGEQARRALELAAANDTAASLDRAVALLESLVDRDPNHPEHVLRLGVAYARRSERPDAATALADTQRAEAAFRHAVALAPGEPIAQQNLAQLLESKENLDVD